MEFQKLSLVFMFICMIDLFVEIKKVNNKFNNIEHMTSAGSSSSTTPSSNLINIRELIRQEYDHDIEAIRNLGTISKSLLTGKNYHNTSPGSGNEGDLIIPANVKIQGWAVAVPIGTVIMWTMNTPPLPNTTRYDFTGVGGHILQDHECWYPCIGNTTSTYLGVSIPEFRGRMVMGQGVHNGNASYRGAQHDMQPLLGRIGGEVPVGQHKHNTVGAGGHNHQTHFINDDYNGQGGGNMSLEDDGGTQRNIDTTSQPDHTHNVSFPVNTRTNAHTDRFNKYTVPHSTILQFWIRVR